MKLDQQEQFPIFIFTLDYIWNSILNTIHLLIITLINSCRLHPDLYHDNKVGKAQSGELPKN